MSITFYLQGVVKTPANIYDVDLCDNSYGILAILDDCRGSDNSSVFDVWGIVGNTIFEISVQIRITLKIVQRNNLSLIVNLKNDISYIVFHITFNKYHCYTQLSKYE